jgi:hypothetical protein
MTQEKAARLEGKELLATLKALGSKASKSQKAEACGYFSLRSDGGKRYNYTAMYQAIAEASGIELNSGNGKAGRSLKWATTVLTTGACLVGQRYMEQLGMEPGDELTIKRQGRKLILEPVAAA